MMTRSLWSALPLAALLLAVALARDAISQQYGMVDPMAIAGNSNYMYGAMPQQPDPSQVGTTMLCDPVSNICTQVASPPSAGSGPSLAQTDFGQTSATTNSNAFNGGPSFTSSGLPTSARAIGSDGSTPGSSDVSSNPQSSPSPSDPAQNMGGVLNPENNAQYAGPSGWYDFIALQDLFGSSFTLYDSGRSQEYLRYEMGSASTRTGVYYARINGLPSLANADVMRSLPTTNLYSSPITVPTSVSAVAGITGMCPSTAYPGSTTLGSSCGQTRSGMLTTIVTYPELATYNGQTGWQVLQAQLQQVVKSGLWTTGLFSNPETSTTPIYNVQVNNGALYSVMQVSAFEVQIYARGVAQPVCTVTKNAISLVWKNQYRLKGYGLNPILAFAIVSAINR